ncbi:phosphoglycerate mutase [Biomphalaria glabrata]|nr:phosphoglycerate mutase [Biomphalaria glabrata]
MPSVLVEGDEGLTLNGNVWRAAGVYLQATKHASPDVGGYEMRPGTMESYQNESVRSTVSLRHSQAGNHSLIHVSILLRLSRPTLIRLFQRRDVLGAMPGLHLIFSIFSSCFRFNLHLEVPPSAFHSNAKFSRQEANGDPALLE